MNLFRSLLFVLAKTLWTLVLGILFLPLLLLSRDRMGQCVPFVWTRGILWMARHICGIRPSLEGTEYIARGAAIYAMKHQSAYETLYLWQVLPQPVFVLKKELLSIPVFGQYLSGTPIIAINRKEGAKVIPSLLRQAREHLEKERQIIIFPEGTRLPPGERKPYKSGIYAIYHAMGLPVIPVAVNTGLVWPKQRFTKTPGTATIRFLPPIEPGMEKAAFMQELENRIEEASLALLVSPGVG